MNRVGATDTTSLRNTDPLDAKRRVWERLDELVSRVQKHGFPSLSREELNEVGRLHRRISAHLAQAQSGISDPALVRYLNRLVLRSHSLIYRTRWRIEWSAIGGFFARGFPETVYRCWAYLAISLVIFYGAGLLAFGVTYAQPANARLFLPPIFADVDPEASDGSWVEELPPGGVSLLSSFIMTNNISVGIKAFAGGILFGTLTVYSLVSNGLMLGGIAALMHGHGRALPFWAVILPHGVIELTAICLCGAAGLRLAAPLIAPGPYSRKDALVRAAPDALRIAAGTIPMFVIAGIIEGFVSPLRLPSEFKLIFSAAWGVALLVYFGAPFLRGLLIRAEH